MWYLFNIVLMAFYVVELVRLLPSFFLAITDPDTWTADAVATVGFLTIVLAMGYHGMYKCVDILEGRDLPARDELFLFVSLIFTIRGLYLLQPNVACT